MDAIITMAVGIIVTPLIAIATVAVIGAVLGAINVVITMGGESHE